MKMLDRFREVEFARPSTGEDVDLAEYMPVEITDVADWLYERGGAVKRLECPIILPPWPKAWYEYTPPGQSLLRRAGVGAFVVRRGSETETQHNSFHDPFPKAEWAWLVYSNVFAERKRDGAFLQAGIVTDALDERGAAIPEATRIQTPEGRVNDPDYSNTVALMVGIAAFASSLAHCKNVKVADIPIPPKVKQNRRKKGQHPGVEYKTLEIDPMKTQVRNEADGNESEIDRALHICRGHFKDYRENGMFGKDSHKGVYWFEQHARGNAENGEVRKDYEVNAPASEHGESGAL